MNFSEVRFSAWITYSDERQPPPDNEDAWLPLTSVIIFIVFHIGILYIGRMPVKTASKIDAKAQAREILRRREPALDPQEFFAPDIRRYIPHFGVIRNMRAAVSLLIEVLDDVSNPAILVAGDYDADGICSVASMSRLLQNFGRPDHGLLLPDRMTEGHGLSASATTRICNAKPDLVIVLDCGTTSQEALARIASVARRGVIVLDHHQAPGMAFPEMPAGVLLINTALDDFAGTDVPADIRRGLAGACAGALVYIFATRFMLRWRQRAAVDADFAARHSPEHDELLSDQSMRELLAEISGLGAFTTIADMAPLNLFNRALVRTSLPYISRIVGLRAMADSFDRRLDIDAPTPADVGFKYGPVINAAGRIHHGNIALRLMIEPEYDEALPLAIQAIEINLERRAIQKAVVDACLEQVDQLDDTGIVVRNEDFHPGVVGLAASRLLEHTGRPAIVIGTGGAGSARSTAGFDIGAFIHRAVKDNLILGGGGHAAAGGFRVGPEAGSHAALMERFRAETRGIRRAAGAPDMIVEFGQICDFGALFDEMAPFGVGNPALSILFRNPVITNEKWMGGEDKPHWRGELANGKGTIDLVWFNARQSLAWPEGRDFLQGVATLRGRLELGNGWKGAYYQIMVESVTEAGECITGQRPSQRPAAALHERIDVLEF